MALTLNSGLLADWRTGCEISMYATISYRSTGGTNKSISIGKAKSPLLNASTGLYLPMLLAGASPISLAVDPLTRKVSYGTMQVDIVDDGPGGLARSIITGNHIRGKKVQVYIGSRSTALANYADYFSGIIHDYTQDSGVIRLMLNAYTTIPRPIEKSGLWANKHNAELIHDILNAAGVPDSLITTANFAFDSNSAKSHYVARRKGVSWSGGPSKSVTAYGDFNDTKFKGWEIANADSINALGVRIYGTINATAQQIDITLYDDFSSSKIKIGVGQIRTSTAFDSDYQTVVISPPHVDTPAGPQYYTYGLKGKVLIKWSGSAYSVALAEQTYLLVDSQITGDQVNCMDACEALAGLMNASLIERENGQVDLKYFVPSGSAIRNWTKNEITKNIKPLSLIENLLNSVIVKGRYTIPNNGGETHEREIDLKIKRETSQTALSVDGGTTPAVFQKEFDTEWTDGSAYLLSTLTDSTATIQVGALDSFRSVNEIARTYGMCGTAGVSAGGLPVVQGADRKADDGKERYIYLMIDDEIIRADHSAITALGEELTLYDDNKGSNITVYTSYQIDYTYCDRGMLGTTAAAHARLSQVHDVTQAAIIAHEILDRFEYGAPIIEVETNIAEYEVQVCDFVTITDDLLVVLGTDGLTSSTLWEVIGKELNGINLKWTLCRVASTVANTSDTHTRKKRWQGDHMPFFGAPLESSLQAGSIPFVGLDSFLSSDDSNLHWNDTEKRMGIGTNSPAHDLHVKKSATASICADYNGTIQAITRAHSSGWVESGSMTGHDVHWLYSNSNVGGYDSAGNFGFGLVTPTQRGHFKTGSGKCAVLVDSTGNYVGSLYVDSNRSYVGSVSDHPLRLIVHDTEHTDLLTSGAYESNDDVADPSTPASGYVRWWFYGGKLHILDDAGKEVVLDIEAKADAAQGSWVSINAAGGSDPKFNTNWQNFNTGTNFAAAYLIDTIGFLHWRGGIKRSGGSGVGEGIIGGLSYYPSKEFAVPLYSGSGATSYVIVKTDGSMTLQAGDASTYLDLSGVTPYKVGSGS